MKNNLSLFEKINYNTTLVNNTKYQNFNNSKKYEIKIAREVEGIFIQILLKSMRNSLIENNLLNNNQSRLYTEIYDEQISKEMSTKGIGLANIILQQIQKK
ncbi:rod-binding protein [Buchnera aphidicola]|uniref:rod-binding protein n=1 Tax=Buchnera aphidicola TaxID=9 RepID=UPI003464B279